MKWALMQHVTHALALFRSADCFDIEVAKKQDATNPVYYVQYAHARICSILRKAAAEAGIEDWEALSPDELAAKLNLDDAKLELLTHESELALMKAIDGFTDLVAGAARDRAPFRLTHYAQDLAGLFHSFYTNCRVLGEEAELTKARLALVDAARIQSWHKALGLLGVSAPAVM